MARATPDHDGALDDAAGADDDEALHWAGDEERGRDAPRLRGSRAPDPAAAVAHDGDGEREVVGSRSRGAATVAFALPYLAWTICWIFVVQRLSSGSTDLATQVLWQFGEFLAMLAGPLWFAATLTLTRESRPLVRVGWLALGLGVLVPWPLVFDFLVALRVAGSLS
ncbi:MAG: hypothetical protein ABIR17_12275 [Pseudolysinimonas sp.]|uniref:hypothetical protein n=1 Tax=Pseudolysinimonas sp. TaxID=2680009 RepID=UPI003264565C